MGQVPCPPGFYCPEASSFPIRCPQGHYCGSHDDCNSTDAGQSWIISYLFIIVFTGVSVPHYISEKEWSLLHLCRISRQRLSLIVSEMEGVYAGSECVKWKMCMPVLIDCVWNGRCVCHFRLCQMEARCVCQFWLCLKWKVCMPVLIDRVWNGRCVCWFWFCLKWKVLLLIVSNRRCVCQFWLCLKWKVYIYMPVLNVSEMECVYASSDCVKWKVCMPLSEMEGVYASSDWVWNTRCVCQFWLCLK